MGLRKHLFLYLRDLSKFVSESILFFMIIYHAIHALFCIWRLCAYAMHVMFLVDNFEGCCSVYCYNEVVHCKEQLMRHIFAVLKFFYSKRIPSCLKNAFRLFKQRRVNVLGLYGALVYVLIGHCIRREQMTEKLRTGFHHSHPPPLIFLAHYVIFLANRCKSRALLVKATKFVSLALSFCKYGMRLRLTFSDHKCSLAYCNYLVFSHVYY